VRSLGRILGELLEDKSREGRTTNWLRLFGGKEGGDLTCAGGFAVPSENGPVKN